MDLINRDAAKNAMANLVPYAICDESTESYTNGLTDAYNLICQLPSVQPEPCEDAVSRRRLLSDLKELIAAWKKYPVMAEQIKGVEAAIGYVETIPFVQQERKKGNWIPVDSYSAFGGDEELWMAHGNPVAFYYCSNCKEQAYAGEDGQSLITNFCPNCGADLMGE